MKREFFFIKTFYVLFIWQKESLNFSQSRMGFFHSALPSGLWHDIRFFVTELPGTIAATTTFIIPYLLVPIFRAVRELFTAHQIFYLENRGK